MCLMRPPGIAKLPKSDRKIFDMNPVSLKTSGLSKASDLIGEADAWMKSASKTGGAAEAQGTGFESVLMGELGKVFGAQKEVDAAVTGYNAGAPEASVERTAFLMAKAEADLRLAVQVRNKAVNAYQEVMNLQI